MVRSILEFISQKDSPHTLWKGSTTSPFPKEQHKVIRAKDQDLVLGMAEVNNEVQDP